MKNYKIVIGDGMLAKNFNKLSNSTNCVFFCSGVSNSQEKDKNAFEREKYLLLSKIKEYSDLKFIYFSSVMVNQSDSDYYMHKLNMEKIVKVNCNTFLIIRLPQVAGVTKSQTLLSFFINRIIFQEELMIETKSYRNLIDIVDVVRVVDLLLSMQIKNIHIDVGAKFNIKPIEMVHMIENILKIKANYILVNKGNKQEIDLTYLNSILSSKDVLNQITYSQHVIEKYTKLFV